MKNPVLPVLLLASCFLVIGCGKKDAASATSAAVNDSYPSVSKERLQILKSEFSKSFPSSIYDGGTITSIEKCDDIEYQYKVNVRFSKVGGGGAVILKMDDHFHVSPSYTVLEGTDLDGSQMQLQLCGPAAIAGQSKSK